VQVEAICGCIFEVNEYPKIPEEVFIRCDRDRARSAKN
jgi:hypothetical protein